MLVQLLDIVKFDHFVTVLRPPLLGLPFVKSFSANRTRQLQINKFNLDLKTSTKEKCKHVISCMKQKLQGKKTMGDEYSYTDKHEEVVPLS